MAEQIDKKDLRVDISGNPDGTSGLRITHLPTGNVVSVASFKGSIHRQQKLLRQELERKLRE